jgi:hypothetical protein
VVVDGDHSFRYIVYTDSKLQVGQDKYAKGILSWGTSHAGKLLTESRTERPEGGYIEERYPQGARTTAGYDPFRGHYYLHYMTLRERITVSSEGEIESSEYDIIITSRNMSKSSDNNESSRTIPVSSTDHIFDITSQNLRINDFAAAYTKNNVLQMTYFRVKSSDYGHSLATEYEDTFPSLQLSNTSERPAFLSYVPNTICTGLAGIDTNGNLINVSSHFSCDANSNYSYVKRAQFIHNTSKQVKPGTVATSVDFANTHIYSLYTDLDGYIRIEYIDSKNRDDWQ